ncbi:putative cobaltochelatase [Candidatus Alkanophaga liquidiphilum]
MRLRKGVLPFAAIVGQDQMKKALIFNAINPRIGGVLIRGEKGTAKSTAVRALAELLPEIEVVKGCPFNCNPRDPTEMCDACYERFLRGETLGIMRRKMTVVDLPLGATEDRVVGTLDVERVIKEGIKALEPGILAAANRGILYIDEVNLLDDHVADVLLDAAALGVNVVEREGISVAHPAKFILVGTMNPEEGELRPQLLDRFGLQVEVESIEDVEKRVEIAKIAEEFEQDSEGFRRKYERQQGLLRSKILKAKELLSDVKISDELLRIIAEACIELGVRTHRAEITTVRTAKTIAAFEGRTEVTLEDVEEAMQLALPHRMRKKPFEPPRLDEERLKETLKQAQEKHDHKHQKADEPEKREQQQQEEESGGEHHKHEHESREQSSGQPTEEYLFGVGEPVDTSQISFKRRKPPLGVKSGRKLETFSTRGKYVGYRIPKRMPPSMNVALDATIRAAAPKQKERRGGKNAILIEMEDIREKVFKRKASAAVVFVVDASGSMAAMRRMEAAKGAVLSLLLDSYKSRDRVGLVAFRGASAEVLLPLCSSVDLALKQLEELPTGGRTPLAAGFELGLRMLAAEGQKHNADAKMLVLVSDGRANVPLWGGDIYEELATLAELAHKENIYVVVIDTEAAEGSLMTVATEIATAAMNGQQNFKLGYCREIAELSGGSYYSLSQLSSEEISGIISNEMWRL